MEELGGCVAEWGDIIFGLEVNAATSIIIVDSKAVMGYSVNVSVVSVDRSEGSGKYTCKKYINTQRSGVRVKYS